jgi:hypothetical protein
VHQAHLIVSARPLHHRGFRLHHRLHVTPTHNHAGRLRLAPLEAACRRALTRVTQSGKRPSRTPLDDTQLVSRASRWWQRCGDATTAPACMPPQSTRTGRSAENVPGSQVASSWRAAPCDRSCLSCCRRCWSAAPSAACCDVSTSSSTHADGSSCMAPAWHCCAAPVTHVGVQAPACQHVPLCDGAQG